MQPCYYVKELIATRLNAGTISTNHPTTTPPTPTPPPTTTPRLRRFISLTGHCSLAPIHTALAGTNWRRRFPHSYYYALSLSNAPDQLGALHSLKSSLIHIVRHIVYLLHHVFYSYCHFKVNTYLQTNNF